MERFTKKESELLGAQEWPSQNRGCQSFFEMRKGYRPHGEPAPWLLRVFAPLRDASSLPCSLAKRRRLQAFMAHPQTRQLPYVPPFFRNPPAGRRLRYSHGSGTIGTQTRLHDQDLHPRIEQGRPRYWQSHGPAVIGFIQTV